MDFLKGNIRSMYGKYLSAAFGSALIGCIYTMVDTAVVGQYQGPQGTAALAVVAPCWNLIYSLGLLLGAGGAGGAYLARHLVLRGPRPDLLRRGRGAAASGADLPEAGEIRVPAVSRQ